MRGSRKNKIIDFFLGVPLVYLLGLIRKTFLRRYARPKKPQRVLFIKLAAIGDTILFLSVIKAFRSKFPDARIDLLASPINQELLRSVPFIDQVHILPLGATSQQTGLFRFLGGLKENQYDLAIDGEQWSRFSPLAAFYAKIQYLVGFKTAGQYRHFLYDEVIEHTEVQPERDSFAELVRGFKITDFEPPQLYFEPQVVQKATTLLGELDLTGKPFLVLHPGCGAHGWQREWPPEKYAALVKELRKATPGLRVLLTGAPAERALTESLAQMIGGGAENLCGRLSLMEMSYVISQANLFVSGNTGPMHIAAATGTPLIALHGPTNAKKWGPLTQRGVVICSPLECSPCLFLGFEYGCQDNKCMRTIELSLVVEAAQKLLISEKAHA